MVMPCSRSASRPSVSSDRSIGLPAARRSSTSSWSARMARLSNSRRPISVLLPSSTLPAVRKRAVRPALAGQGGHQK
jgi:hypothetical protein